MSSHPLSPVTERDRRPLAWWFRVSRLALLFLFLVNVGGALWNALVVVPRVRPDRVAEYVWLLVLYPSALACVTGISIWWIRGERIAGAVLGAALLAFQGIKTLIGVLAPEESYPSPVSRAVGQLVLAGFATVFLGASVALVRAAGAFRRQRDTLGS
jgi:hypothetical protein